MIISQAILKSGLWNCHRSYESLATVPPPTAVISRLSCGEKYVGMFWTLCKNFYPKISVSALVTRSVRLVCCTETTKSFRSQTGSRAHRVPLEEWRKATWLRCSVISITLTETPAYSVKTERYEQCVVCLFNRQLFRAYTCLERSSLWRYVCPLAGRFWTAFKDRTFSPLLQRCLTVIFSTLIVVLEMDFLFRPL